MNFIFNLKTPLKFYAFQWKGDNEQEAKVFIEAFLSDPHSEYKAEYFIRKSGDLVIDYYGYRYPIPDGCYIVTDENKVKLYVLYEEDFNQTYVSENPELEKLMKAPEQGCPV